MEADGNVSHIGLKHILTGRTATSTSFHVLQHQLFFMCGIHVVLISIAIVDDTHPLQLLLPLSAGESTPS